MLRTARILLVVVSILNGLAGLICGALIVVAPDGHFLQMGALAPVVATLPLASLFFRDFFWIGVAMLLALGIPNLVAAVMLIRRQEPQYFVALVAAALLVSWCTFELVYMFNFAAVGYLVVGLVSLACSALLLRRDTPIDA